MEHHLAEFFGEDRRQGVRVERTGDRETGRLPALKIACN